MSEATLPPGALRILVVGDTGVGKTLLLRRLRQACAPDRDGLAVKWGPTTGFGVEVLSVPLGPRRSRDVHSHSLPNPHDYHREQSRHSEDVCVAFLELGGNRNFGRSSHYPVGLMSFDGVIFVYDRQSPASAVGLHCWHDDLRAHGIVGGAGGARILLIEAALTEPPTATGAAGLPDELGGAYLRSGGARPGPSRAAKCVAAALRWARPSVPDMQQQQRRRGGGARLLLIRLAALVENALLFLTAVVLFGPQQQSVPLRRPSVAESLAMIRSDVGGTVTIDACPLYDQLRFEAAAVEEVMAFVAALRETEQGIY